MSVEIQPSHSSLCNLWKHFPDHIYWFKGFRSLSSMKSIQPSLYFGFKGGLLRIRSMAVSCLPVTVQFETQSHASLLTSGIKSLRRQQWKTLPWKLHIRMSLTGGWRHCGWINLLYSFCPVQRKSENHWLNKPISELMIPNSMKYGY